MKRNTILTLVIGAIISISAVSLWRSGAQAVIGTGYDQFSTPDNAVTSETLYIKEGTFSKGGVPSKAFNDKLTLKGGPAVPGFTGDTVIERTNAVQVPGQTGLRLFGLRLVSAAPIRIDFVDNSSAYYNVTVKESSTTASEGTMYFNANNTFSSSLQINREYTFTSQGLSPVTIDSAAAGWAAIGLSATGSWSPSSDTHATNAAVPTGGVIIRPNTEQALLASHGIVPPPPPSPTPTPTPTPTRTKTPIGVIETPVQDQPVQSAPQ